MRKLGGKLFDEDAAEGIRVLRNHDKRAGAADNVVVVVVYEPARRVRVVGVRRG